MNCLDFYFDIADIKKIEDYCNFLKDIWEDLGMEKDMVIWVHPL